MLMGMMIVVGFIVGFLVGCTGMGGIILIPALVYLSGLSSHVLKLEKKAAYYRQMFNDLSLL